MKKIKKYIKELFRGERSFKEVSYGALAIFLFNIFIYALIVFFILLLPLDNQVTSFFKNTIFFSLCSIIYIYIYIIYIYIYWD
jgi:hypothetical protein